MLVVSSNNKKKLSSVSCIRQLYICISFTLYSLVTFVNYLQLFFYNM